MQSNSYVLLNFSIARFKYPKRFECLKTKLMYSTGLCFNAAADSGEGEGAAEDIPESITDGEHIVKAHESPLVPYGNDHQVKQKSQVVGQKDFNEKYKVVDGVSLLTV